MLMSALFGCKHTAQQSNPQAMASQMYTIHFCSCITSDAAISRCSMVWPKCMLLAIVAQSFRNYHLCHLFRLRQDLMMAASVQLVIVGMTKVKMLASCCLGFATRPLPFCEHRTQSASALATSLCKGRRSSSNTFCCKLKMNPCPPGPRRKRFRNRCEDASTSILGLQ